MTLAQAKTLKEGAKIKVSYKGIRPCTFKNIKGNCAFVVFDSGDGTGCRLHRVLATTLVAEQAKPAVAKPAKAQEADDTFDLLKRLADRLGYELIAK